MKSLGVGRWFISMRGVVGVALALIGTGVLYQAVGLQRARRRFLPPGELVDVGGHRLHVVCRGAGSPVVVLESGIAASSLSWARVQPDIASFTRACAYDRAGLAWSDASSCPRTFTRIVEELGAVIAHGARGERVILVGHSFGSFVVRAYAAAHPDHVAGIVLIDPATEWLTITPARQRMMRGGQQLSRIGAVLAHVGVVRACLALLTGGVPGAPRRFVKIFGPTAAGTLERLVGEVRKLPPEVHPAVQALWCQPKCFRAMAEHLVALEREGASLLTAPPHASIPVVVISSRGQPAEEVAAHRQLANSSMSGRHVIAAQSGHWIQFDEPELIVDAVKELVNWSRSGSRSMGPT
jgi:pimeloyl-ACP methyl ester carboxylesterase